MLAPQTQLEWMDCVNQISAQKIHQCLFCFFAVEANSKNALKKLYRLIRSNNATKSNQKYPAPFLCIYSWQLQSTPTSSVPCCCYLLTPSSGQMKLQQPHGTV